MAHDIAIRRRAAELFVHRRMPIPDISRALGVPEGTLRRWQWEDDWADDYQVQREQSFARACDNLMRTIDRLSERLFQSTIPPDDAVDSDFILPDENLELRINRLTYALDRIMPLGNMLLRKQRVDVVAEIKQLWFESDQKGVFKQEEIMIALRLLEYYLDSINTGQKQKAA
jgi:hypothetical protein